jgi:uncharacterized protein DUF3592
MSVQYLAAILPIAAIVLGAVFAAKSVSLRRQSLASAKWPTVMGEIIGSRIDTAIIDNSTAVEDEESAGRRHLPHDDEVSTASVRYSYCVAGKEYQSTRLYIGRPVFYGVSAVAAAAAAKYPPHARVPVYYNPDNPAEAVLEPLNFANARLALGAAAGFGSCGLLALLALLNVQ